MNRHTRNAIRSDRWRSRSTGMCNMYALGYVGDCASWHSSYRTSSPPPSNAGTVSYLTKLCYTHPHVCVPGQTIQDQTQASQERERLAAFHSFSHLPSTNTSRKKGYPFLRSFLPSFLPPLPLSPSQSEVGGWKRHTQPSHA